MCSIDFPSCWNWLATHLFSVDWGGVGKPLIGTLVGGGIAFYTNWWLQKQTRTRDNIAAGQRALFTIRSQFDDFCNCRYGLRVSMARVSEAMSKGPFWLYAKPMGFHFNAANVFDFKSLGFLLATEAGMKIYGRLQFLERTYLDFTGRLEDINTSALELQKESVPVYREKRDITFEEMENKLGPELIGRTNDQQCAVVLRLERDGPRYLKFYAQLNDALAKIFKGEKGFKKLPQLDTVTKFCEDQLPALPAVFVPYLVSIPVHADDGA